MSAGRLALHIAGVPGALCRFVQQNPAQAPKFGATPQPASREEILNAFDESVATVRSQLPQFDDRAMDETWRPVADGNEVMAVPRRKFVRDVMFSHLDEDRGQFGVYLRILNVPVPAG